MIDWREEVRKMPEPSEAEIAEWAEGIVYGKTSDGTEVYFDPVTRTWRKVAEAH